MSCFKNDKYYALISCPTGELKILKCLSPIDVCSATKKIANYYGIFGEYLFSAQDKALIADDIALLYSLERNHTIIVSEYKYLRNIRVLYSKTAFKDTSTDLDLEFTGTERKAFKAFVKAVVKALGEEAAPTEQPIPNIKTE